MNYIKVLKFLSIAIVLMTMLLFTSCELFYLRDVIPDNSYNLTPTVDILDENSSNTKSESIREPNEPYSVPIEEINAVARTLYGECRGVPSDMEKAAVVWVILNRVDAGYGDTIIEVVSEPYQFIGYDESYPVLEELANLAEDVIIRWYREKEGESDVGRVLPIEYLWFHGDGEHNYFRDQFRGGNRWSWSLRNPYEN